MTGPATTPMTAPVTTLPDVEFSVVGPERATDVVGIVHETFGDRPVLDPPATAMDETVESVARALSGDGGLLAVHHGRPVGALLLEDHGALLQLRRVGVLREVRHLGVAAQLVHRAEQVAAERGYRGLVLEAREELPVTVRFWQRLGYAEVDRSGPRLWLERRLPVTVTLPDAEDTRALGERLGGILTPGDLVVLSGDLGAGKTTLTQGIGEGLGVRGPVTSPTFVIARLHPSLRGGPALAHVDAYRLHDAAELDDLDLDTDLDEAVTIVEWGSGLAEALAGSRLEIRMTRAPDDVRTVEIAPVGPRWFDADLSGVTGPAAG
ncbi:MAG: tRNA (adenosine(37)-N6)-threonylcarbamoyltransferase complex ATPase subunit type 1 TsaE [Marmoricola sp.]